MESCGWYLIQSGIFIRRGSLDTQRDTRQALAQTKDHMRIQQGGGRLQAKDTSLWRNKTSRHLDLRLPASRAVRYTLWLFKSPNLLVFCYGSLDKLIQCSKAFLLPLSHLSCFISLTVLCSYLSHFLLFPSLPP